jgi:hypothetical protein
MANDRKSHGLYCQKCRTPIDVDASIDQLNPAAFKLLTGQFVANSNLYIDTNIPTRLHSTRPADSLEEYSNPPVPPNLPLLKTPDVRDGHPVGKKPYIQAQCPDLNISTWCCRAESCYVVHRCAHV